MYTFLIKLATLICLIFMSEAIFPLLAVPTREEVVDFGLQTIPATPLWYHVYYDLFWMASATLCLLERKRIIFIFQKNKGVFFLLGFMLLSCAWSLDPGKSLYFVAKILWAFFFGLFLVSRFSTKEILSLLWMWAATIILADWFFVLLLPHYAMEADGSWRGAFGDRNESAMVSNIAFATMIVAASGIRNVWWTSIGMALLAVVLIVMSGSATGIITLCALCISGLLIRFARMHWRLCLILLLAGMCFTILIMLLTAVTPQLSHFFMLLGKDETLTGRLDIWTGIVNAIHGHLLGGYGAQDLFITTRGQVLTESYVSPDGDFAAMAPHNLYFAIVLKYGLIGAALFAWVACKAVSVSLQQLMGTSVMRYWYILFMIASCIFGLTLTIDYKILLWMLLALVLGSPYMRDADERLTVQSL